MGGKSTSWAGGLVALLAWLAMVLADGVAPAAPSPDPGLVAFLAAGGSLDDICGDGGHHAPGERHCDACRLLDPLVLAEPPRVVPAHPCPLAVAVVPAAASVSLVSPLGPGAARAPPFAS